ncbi:MAG: ABC transporter permease [Thermoproteota archaeon]
MRIIVLLKWELASLFRLKLILPLVAFTFLTSQLRIFTGMSQVVSGVWILSGDREGWLRFFAQSLGWQGTFSIAELYLALAFFSAILVSTSLTGEFESGVLKFYSSLPVSRLKIFVAKFLTVFVTVFLTGISAIYYELFMEAPEEFFSILIAAPFYILQPCLLLALASLFTFAVSLYFSVNSRRAWHASIYSLITLYSLHTVREIAPGGSLFLPPYSFAFISQEMTSLLYTTFFSVLLICFSCYIFVRKVEVP